MKNNVLVAGHESFNKKLALQVSKSDCNIETKAISSSLIQSHYELMQLKAPIERASVVFIGSGANVLPVAELALKHSKHVVLFGVNQCKHVHLLKLLELSIESKSLLVNGDSLLFNPAIYQTKELFQSTEITTISSNRFQHYLTNRSIFNCIELLMYTNASPLKNVSVKAVLLNHKRLNVLHTRLEFENGNLGVLEMSNCKPQSNFLLESAGQGTWLSLDLLSFNGQKHNLRDQNTLSPPEQVYSQERNPIKNLFHYIENELPTQINPQRQFSNTIYTSEVILKMEDQLRREVPNFARFKDEK